MERRSKPVDPPCRFTDLVLPQPKKIGSSDAPEPLSSNDVAATMALNSVRISGWWLLERAISIQPMPPISEVASEVPDIVEIVLVSPPMLNEGIHSHIV